MPWIESHTSLAHHHKLLKLRKLTGWAHNECIGTLHRLWWWALTYAENGLLDRFDSATISLGIDARETDIYDHENFFDAFTESEWIDADRKIHDWWDYVGKYLKSKYRNNHPEIIKKIQRLYDGKARAHKGQPKGQSKSALNTPHITLPNLTEPNKKKKEKRDLRTEFSGIHKTHEPLLREWELWQEYRANKRKKLSPFTIDKQIKQLESCSPEVATKMLSQSIEKGWDGIFPLKDSPKGMTAEQENELVSLKRDLRIAQDTLKTRTDTARFNPDDAEAQRRVQAAENEIRALESKIKRLGG